MLSIVRPWVPRLIQAQLAPAWKADHCKQAPSFVADGTTFNAHIREPGALRLHVVAHEINFVLVIALGWMTGDLGLRRGKYQPAVPSIDRG